MSQINWGETLFLGTFFLLYFVVPALIGWASYCERFQTFDLRSLWTHNGRPDKLAVIILGTWWIHSCTIILWTLSRTITTADFVTYMGWALPIIAKMFAPGGERAQVVAGAPSAPGDGA